MAKYRIYAKVLGSKYIGEVEADSIEDAIEKGYEHDNAYVGLCHQCSGKCENPEVCIDETTVELVEGSES